MKFSARTAWEPGANAWAEAVADARMIAQLSGASVVDLTVANPTACGLGPPSASVLGPLSAPGALQYQPDPLGMPTAREAVAAYYRDHRAHVAAERICLTTSTSEAYSFLFRLLCDPGDEVLIGRPGYPLFDLLARLDNVHLREYPLFYEPGWGGGGEPGGPANDETGWQIDFAALESTLSGRTRAIVVVHPNNPTGHFVTAAERETLTALCLKHNLALIVDEVFLDYAHSGDTTSAHRTFAGEAGCLTFVLSGLSKICALPQMKCSWIVASGPPAAVDEAMRRLEIIADTFLSLNAPVQFALTPWLAGRHPVQNQLRARLRDNLATLDRRLRGSLGGRLALGGGWSAVLRVPRFIEGIPFVHAALARGVLVQPGELYGLPDGRCVLSLLTEPAAWADGLNRLPL